MCSGDPPVPLMRASGTCCWSGGSPPPPPPLRPLALCAGCRLGVILVSVLPLGPHALCACWGSPSGSGGPPLGGLPLWSSWGSPLLPSLHTVGARRWVRVPPLPSPPLRTLALSARGRLGGGLSAISASAVRPAALSLLWVSSVPAVQWAVSAPPCRPLALRAHDRSRGALSAIASPAMLAIPPALLGVSSPPDICWYVPAPPRQPLAFRARCRSRVALSAISLLAVLFVAPALLGVSSPPAVC